VNFNRCILQACPVLPQDVQHQLLALEEAQLLHTAVTSFAYPAEGWLERLLRWGDVCLGSEIVPRLHARRLPPCVARRVRSQPSAELLQRWAKWRHAVKAPAMTDAWFGAIDRAAARHIQPSIRLTIGREDACLASFTAAKASGSLCLYVLPTAYYATVRQVMEREHAEFPGAAIQSCLSDEYEIGRCQRKDTEVAAADRILVPSQFVVDSLLAAGIPPTRVYRLPWGCEPRFDPCRKASTTGRKIVLNVGNISVRKGIPRLLRAWKRLGAYRTHRLRIIGSRYLKPRFLAEYSSVFEYLPHLPRNELARHYAAAYAFVFPAACEGLGLVLNEALSHGLPCVASTNSGAVGFITDGQEGLIYPFGEDDQLCAALDRMLSRPRETAEMGQAAYQLAQRWTWTDYRKMFCGLVLDLLGTSPSTANSAADQTSEKGQAVLPFCADRASVLC